MTKSPSPPADIWKGDGRLSFKKGYDWETTIEQGARFGKSRALIKSLAVPPLRPSPSVSKYHSKEENVKPNVNQVKLWRIGLSHHPIYSALAFLPVWFIIWKTIGCIVSIGLQVAGLTASLEIISLRNLIGLSFHFGAGIAAMFVSAIVWTRLLGDNGLEFIGLDHNYRKVFVGILWGICLQFSIFLILVFSTWLKIDAFSFNNLAILNVLMYTVTALNTGFTEEIIFRGVLFSSLRSRWGWWATALTTALLFAIPHLINNHYDFPIITVIYISFIGLLFAWVREITGSLWILIGIHFIWDAAIHWFNLVASKSPHLIMTSFNAPKWVVGNGGISDWILAIVFATSIWLFYVMQRKVANRDLSGQ